MHSIEELTTNKQLELYIFERLAQYGDETCAGIVTAFYMRGGIYHTPKAYRALETIRCAIRFRYRLEKQDDSLLKNKSVYTQEQLDVLESYVDDMLPPKDNIVRPFLDVPKFGWATLRLGTYEQSVSYLTDVPMDCLNNMLDALKNENRFVIEFDTEGKEDIRVISTTENTTLYAFKDAEPETYTVSDTMYDIAARICDNIEQDIEGWARWDCDENEEERAHEREVQLKEGIMKIRGFLKEHHAKIMHRRHAACMKESIRTEPERMRTKQGYPIDIGGTTVDIIMKKHPLQDDGTKEE